MSTEIQQLRAFLAEKGYGLEIEETPVYFPPFVWTFAVKGNERIPLCSTTSYYLSNDHIDQIPDLFEREIRKRYA